MKIVLYVHLMDLEYLDKILSYHTLEEEYTEILASFERFEFSVEVILTYKQLIFLTDNGIVSIDTLKL